MKKLLLFLALLLPSLALADNAGFSNAFVMGTGITTNTASRSDALNASGTTIQFGYGFLAPASGTIDEVCFWRTARTGSPDGDDGVINIEADVSSHPSNSSLSNSTFSMAATGLACATVSQAVTVGTQYWFVLSNQATTQASNYVSIYQGPQLATNSGGAGRGNHSVACQGPAVAESTDNGSTWTALQRCGSAAYRVHYSGGTYYGLMLKSDSPAADPIATADRVYSTNEVGNQFTTPANASMKLIGVVFRGGVAAGTPTGFLRARLYNGTSKALIATSDPYTVVSTSSAAYGQTFYFATAGAQTLSANTSYIVALGETTQSDTSSNAYGPHRMDTDTNAASLALNAFNGTITKTTCSSSCDGGSWTPVAGSYYQMDLILLPGSEFAAGSGGAAGAYPAMNGGMQ